MAGPRPESNLYLGLISGTSADGVDAALVQFDPEPATIATRTFPYPGDLREAVLRLSQASGEISLDELGELDARLGECFAEAALALLAEAGVEPAAVRAIGSHGQTLRHRPDAAWPFTWQLGDAHRIAERTGIDTVADFRRRDLAAGGQGAPLMPAFHAAIAHHAGEERAVLNLGGIANLTLLPARGPVRGFDTGPGNGLLDAWAAACLGRPFDAQGAFAASGRVDPTLLARLLDDPYFDRPAPKSTGREYFNLAWLRPRLAGRRCGDADVQASLCALTAETIAAALRREQPRTGRLLVCGGGVHNAALLDAIATRLPDVAVESTAAHGIDPDFVEAAGFAWLARETLSGRAGNLPAATGARGARVLGAIHPGARLSRRAG